MIFFRWMGSIGDSHVDEFFLPGDSDRYFLKSKDMLDLEDYYDCGCSDHNLDSLSVEECVKQTPWEKGYHSSHRFARRILGDKYGK